MLARTTVRRGSILARRSTCYGILRSSSRHYSVSTSSSTPTAIVAAAPAAQHPQRFPVLGVFLNNEQLQRTLQRLLQDGLTDDAALTFRAFKGIPDQQLWRVYLQHLFTNADLNTFEMHWNEMQSQFGSLPNEDYVLLFKALSMAFERQTLRPSVALSELRKRWLEFLKRIRSKKAEEDGAAVRVLNIYLQILEQQKDVATLQRMANEAALTNSAHLIFDAIMRIYLQQGDEANALAVYAEMKGKGYEQITVPTSLKLIEYAFTRGRGSMLDEMLKELKQQNPDIPVHSSIYAALIDAYSDTQQAEVIWSIFELLMSRKELDHVLLRKIVRGLSTTNNVDKIQQLYKILREAHPKGLTTQQYNAILHGLSAGLKSYTMSGIIEFMLSIYGDMTTHTMPLLSAETDPLQIDRGAKKSAAATTLTQPRSKHTTAASNRQLQQQPQLQPQLQPQSASNPVDAIEAKPDLYTLNAILMAYARLGSVKKMEETLKIMRDHNIIPDIASYISLVIGYAYTKGGSKAIFKLLDEMAQSGVKPNIHFCTTLLDVFSRLQSDEGLKRAEEIMKKNEIAFTETTYLALIGGHASQDKEEILMTLLQRMRKEGMPPTVKIYNAVVHYLASKRNTKQMIQVYKRMQDDGLAPNATTYTSLIFGFNKGGAPERCFSLYEELKKLQVAPTTATYTSLFDACGYHRQLDQIPRLWKEMLEFGVRPNTNSYTTIMEAYLRSGRVEQAIGVIERMEADRLVQPSNKLLLTFAAFFVHHESADVRRIAEPIVLQLQKHKSERILTQSERAQFVALREELLRAAETGAVLF